MSETARHQNNTESASRDLKSRSEETRRILGQLLHDVTQPLTALRGTLEVALLPGQSPGELEVAARAALGIVETVTESFALVKDAVESDDPGDQVQSVQWSELVRRAIKDFSQRTETRQVRVSFLTSESTSVLANSERLFKATADCLQMAVEGSPPAGTVEVSLTRRSEDLIFKVRSKFHMPQTGRIHRNSPKLISFDEVKIWKLKRMIEAQGGEFWTESAPKNSRSLCLLMPTRVERD